jgi:putative thioredoxin
MYCKNEVIKNSAEHSVVVDYWAPCCGPCQALSPVIEALAEEADDKWQLAKVNTGDYPDLMQRF